MQQASLTTSSLIQKISRWTAYQKTKSTNRYHTPTITPMLWLPVLGSLSLQDIPQWDEEKLATRLPSHLYMLSVVEMKVCSTYIGERLKEIHHLSILV